ncbi:hypothetical protein QUF74_18825 [Candidatus Halobeggiatoa sp. HSG11]|nr:hypothetical protein [Candidatus Halobeggiatoa sp. HSG11]
MTSEDGRKYRDIFSQLKKTCRKYGSSPAICSVKPTSFLKPNSFFGVATTFWRTTEKTNEV